MKPPYRPSLHIRGQYMPKPWAYYYGKMAELLKELMFDVEITDEERMKLFETLPNSIENHKMFLMRARQNAEIIPTLEDLKRCHDII